MCSLQSIKTRSPIQIDVNVAFSKEISSEGYGTTFNLKILMFQPSKIDLCVVFFNNNLYNNNSFKFTCKQLPTEGHFFQLLDKIHFENLKSKRQILKTLDVK